MPTVLRPTIKNDGSTSAWYEPVPNAPRAAARKQVCGNSDEITAGGFYTFPSPQRTTRPGLPGQTRFPKAP